MPLLLIIGGALHSRSRYIRNHPWPPTQLLDADSRREGVLLYGWSNRYVYSAYGTFPSHPEVDLALGISMMSNRQSGLYKSLLQDPRHQPKTIVDLVAVGKEGLLNGAPSLQELRSRPEGEWLRGYTLVLRSPEGWVYQRTKARPKTENSGTVAH